MQQDKEKLERRAKRFYVLFWLLLIIGSIGINIYRAWYLVRYGIDITDVPSLFHLSCGVVVGAVFVPILTQVRKWAQAAEADRLHAKATKWYRICQIAAVGTVIVNLLGWLFPGMFS